MRLLLVWVLAAASSTAAAEPCAVRIARAPDEVRAAIETWIRSEPRCATALEVRIVPTDGGYYLHARDVSGQTRERIVPDAQAVGVLVASWAAADAPAPAPIVPLGPPDDVAPVVPGALAVRRTAPASRRELVVEATGWLGFDGGAALRGDLELRHGGWLAYAGGSVGQSRVQYDVDPYALSMLPHDYRLAVGVGHLWGTRTWRLRTRLGGVVSWWRAVVSDDPVMPAAFDSRFIGVEADLRVDRRVTERWSLTFGLEGSHFLSQHDASTTIVLFGPSLQANVVAGLHVRI